MTKSEKKLYAIQKLIKYYANSNKPCWQLIAAIQFVLDTKEDDS